MKKKTYRSLLALALAFGLAACGSGNQTPAQSPVATPDSTLAPKPSTTQPVDDDGSGSVLVAYYSATGSTEAVAGYIADALDADTFAITPAQPYTSDDLNWTDENSRVSREHDDPALRAVELTAATVDNWDDYDAVFIGYPIWWGIAAWPVDSFVSANDFTGKMVIPFATSSSSGMGESGRLLAQLTGTGDWQEGQRFSSRVAEADVVAWVNGLDI